MTGSAGSRWTGWHLHLPVPPEGFLLECLAPLVARGEIGRCFFLRYDEGGPHLRLRVLPPRGREGEVRDRVEAAVQTWAESAGVEGWRLEPHPYDRAELYFGESAASVLSELLNEATSRLALQLLAAPGGRERTRLWLGLAALLDALVRCAWPGKGGYAAALDASLRFAREASLAVGRGIPDAGARTSPALDAALQRARAALGPALAEDRRVARTARLLRRAAGTGRDGGLAATHALHLLCNKLGFTLHEEHDLFTALARTGAPGGATLHAPTKERSMSEWSGIHIYYRDLDRLIVDCVQPALEREAGGLERRFWERHYAGGPHLRIRLRGAPDAVRAAEDAVAAAAEAYVAGNPSPALATYSPTHAETLMRKEGEEPDPADLRYRNNLVERRPYRPARELFASDQALALAEDFRHDTVALAARVLSSGRAKNEEVLRIYFMHALVICRGNMPAGMVSCRSHWEGFAASFPAVEALDRIRATYERSRDSIRASLREVAAAFRAGPGTDPVVDRWRELVEEYEARTRRHIAAGEPITEQPTTPAEVKEMREKVFTHFHTESGFVNTFWSDDRFIASMQFEPGWLAPRVMTNLLYQFVSTVGISPMERMALCHFAYRSAEEEYGADCAEILRGNIERTLAANAHRWATA
jgi:thiopeptide-type bacteriocin biosynthesis protein